MNMHSLCWTTTGFAFDDSGDYLPMTKASSDSPSVAVERALTMLEAVAQEPDGLSNAEISRKLNIPKSSASYILRTLETQGYLTRDEESKSQPGSARRAGCSRSRFAHHAPSDA
jgi:DNA-binding transcriptional ArsR family regulator